MERHAGVAFRVPLVFDDEKAFAVRAGAERCLGAQLDEAAALDYTTAYSAVIFFELAKRNATGLGCCFLIQARKIVGNLRL